MFVGRFLNPYVAPYVAQWTVHTSYTNSYMALYMDPYIHRASTVRDVRSAPLWCTPGEARSGAKNAGKVSMLLSSKP